METAENRKQLSLLLVDDDVELCGMMKAFFAQAGHHLDCAYNGRDGLTELRELQCTEDSRVGRSNRAGDHNGLQ
jgi:CheY-like chemotaxis protein